MILQRQVHDTQGTLKSKVHMYGVEVVWTEIGSTISPKQ